jgi:hypothetical protein
VLAGESEAEATKFFCGLITDSLDNFRDRLMNDFAHAARH